MTDNLTVVPPALVALSDKLRAIKEKIDALDVKTPSDILTAKQLEMDVKNFKKAVELSDFARDVAAKKEVYDTARAQMAMLLEPGKTLLEAIVNKRKTAEREEERKAEVERARLQAEVNRQQKEKADADEREAKRAAAATKAKRVQEIRELYDRKEINLRTCEKLLREAGANEEAAKAQAAAAAEELRNAPAPVVTVKPDIPTLQGTVTRKNWKFKITKPALIPLVYRIPDEKAIGEMVREKKNKEIAEKECCGGIEVWSE